MSMMSQFLLPLSLLLLAPPSLSQKNVSETIRFRLVNEALAQAEQVSADWDPGQRDCAGLVRFLYRKTTGSRDPLWRRADGTRAHFVAADELVAYNFAPISRAPIAERVETGDLLAFYDPEKPREAAWHLMILLRPPATAPGRLLAIYHNGSTGLNGAVRKVWLDDLLVGPEEWRPQPGNPAFLGTFRWNGWSTSNEGAPR
jgi:uncharacterized protein YfaT (DUF1175 family)